MTLVSLFSHLFPVLLDILRTENSVHEVRRPRDSAECCAFGGATWSGAGVEWDLVLAVRIFIISYVYI